MHDYELHDIKLHSVEDSFMLAHSYLPIIIFFRHNVFFSKFVSYYVGYKNHLIKGKVLTLIAGPNFCLTYTILISLEERYKLKE